MRVSLLLPLIAVAFVCGCSTPGPALKAPAPAVSVDPAVNPRAIAKGMSAEEVIRRIGKPAEIQPLKTAEGHAEVWVYHRIAGQKTVQSATSTRQIPVPAASGETRLIDEPVFSLEQITFEESISLLMYDGKLVEWKKSVEGKRAFN